MMAAARAPVTALAISGLLAFCLQGCGHGGDTPTPSPSPSPTPAPPVPPKVAPDPANWTYRIPENKNFYCIDESHKAKAGTSQRGFFVYRWTNKMEATEQQTNTDNFGDINPYYLLTELFTNLGGVAPLASKPTCTIPKCGDDPAAGGCVLERVYLMMDNSGAKEVLEPDGTWGQYLSVDNGIPSQYSYWAFNWSEVDNPNDCEEDTFTSACNFYFKGGYPVGCQAKSDVMDTPVWYSTVSACPQYPFNPTSTNPKKVDPKFVWHPKLNSNDPAVKECNKEMPGGNYCGGEKGAKQNMTPFTDPSPTCTWKAINAGYMTVEDILSIEKKFPDYKSWCLSQPDEISKYGDGLGIPSNMSLFYNLSVESFPSLSGITSQKWHEAASTDSGELNDEAKEVFKSWAKFAKERLEAMFTEMDKQAFKYFNDNGIKDPAGNSYENCLSNADVKAPACNNGIALSTGDQSALVNNMVTV
mmetsp:Transcript_51701/g.123066  ORF Transcript_51701/g.123066 Transcript_51701/m.123066 type:complete len:472 (+) Transcript_51701:144-1559(+)